MAVGFLATAGIASFALLMGFAIKLGAPGQETTYSVGGLRDRALNAYGTFYKQATAWGGGDTDEDAQNNKEAAQVYFDLATEFFEYGWGDAFHMSPLKPGWNFDRSMAFWETAFWNRIGVHKNMTIADLGMGVGGPLRRLAEFAGCKVTGVSNVPYQHVRAAKITSGMPQGIKDLVTYVEDDYNTLTKLKDNSFDAAYFMESLSHCGNRSEPLSAARRIVKPGGIVGAWQWMLLPEFDYNNPEHIELKRGMEYGGGLRNLNKPDERIKEFLDAGLEVIESYNMGTEALAMGHRPWYTSLTEGHDIPHMLMSSYVGRRITMVVTWVLETVGIAQPGTFQVSQTLEHCGFSAAEAGKKGVFTPLWVTIGRVPLDKKN